MKQLRRFAWTYAVSGLRLVVVVALGVAAAVAYPCRLLSAVVFAAVLDVAFVASAPVWEHVRAAADAGVFADPSLSKRAVKLVKMRQAMKQKIHWKEQDVLTSSCQGPPATTEHPLSFARTCLVSP